MMASRPVLTKRMREILYFKTRKNVCGPDDVTSQRQREYGGDWYEKGRLHQHWSHRLDIDFKNVLLVFKLYVLMFPA